MPFRSMEQGIQAIREGKRQEGARLLKIALKSPDLKGSMRATAYLWLAETKDSPQAKVQCYRDGLEADPDHKALNKRMAAFYSEDLPSESTTRQVVPPTEVPPAPPPATAAVYNPMPATPPTNVDNGAQELKNFYRTVGILGGPNGAGTGFFVHKDGIIATTRFVVGGSTEITVELEPQFRVRGEVVMSFPEIDVALVKTNLTVNQLLPFSKQPRIPDNAPLTAVSYNGRVMSGQSRPTQSRIRPEWFTTTINVTADAGGNPVFDGYNSVVGMLTRNTNRTSPYFFGALIDPILRFVYRYEHEARDPQSVSYCPSCGALSRAGKLGGYYCETCGSLLPEKDNVRRFPISSPQLEAVYGENIHRPCPHCQVRVGYFDDGRCLRCGHKYQEQKY